MTTKKERISDIFVENENRRVLRGVALTSWMFTLAKFVWEFMFVFAAAGSYSYIILQSDAAMPLYVMFANMVVSPIRVNYSKIKIPNNGQSQVRL